jgi:hypothetical protein
MIVLDKEVFLEAMRLLNAKTDELLSLQKA